MKKRYILNGKIYNEDELSSYAEKSGLSLPDYLKESGAQEHNDTNTYILNGKEYDGNTMADYAEKSGMQFDEYLNEAGVKKKEPTPATPVGQPGPVSSTPSKEVAPNSFSQLWEEKVANSKLETPSTSPTETKIEKSKRELSEQELFAQQNAMGVLPFKTDAQPGINTVEKQKIVQSVVNPFLNPNVSTLTTEDKRNQINAKLIDAGLTSPEIIAQQDKDKLDKQTKLDEIAQADIGKPVSEMGDNQEEFFGVPQNITKNIFTTPEEKEYIVSANKYLYDLKETNPDLYNEYARQFLGYKGGDILDDRNRSTTKLDNVSIQRLKQRLINESQAFEIKDKSYDLGVLVKRVGGTDKITEYLSFKKGLEDPNLTPEGKVYIENEFNSRFSQNIQDLEKILEYSNQLNEADRKVTYADKNINKLAYNDRISQVAYDASAEIAKSLGFGGLYSAKDAASTVWNTTIQAANGVLQLAKKFDQNNSYGLVDLWSDSFNQSAENLTIRTAQRKLYEDGKVDATAILPMVASGLTSMYLMGKGGNALSKAIGFDAGTVVSSFAVANNDYYQQARGKMSDQQATNFSIAAAGLTSMLELVSPGKAIWGESGVLRMPLNEAIERFAKGESFEKIVSPITKELIDENIQEFGQSVGDKFMGGVANTIVGKDAIDTDYNLNEFLETVVATTLATGLAGGIKGVAVEQSRSEIVNELSKNSKVLEIALNTIQNNVANGLISEDKAIQLTEELTTRNAQIKALPEEYSDAKKNKIIELQDQLLPYQNSEIKIVDGKVVESKLTEPEQKAVDAINAKIDSFKNLSNDFFDTIALTEKQKADELAKGNPAVVTSVLETPELTPEQKAQQIIELENKAKEPIVTETTVGEVIDVPVMKDGKKGTIYQDGQTLVFKYAEGNREIELGNVDEIKDKGVSQFGLKQEERSVSFNDNNQLTVEGTPYVNNFSKPLEAINYDADGNILSVSLNTEDGKNRTFKGQIAEDIAYQLHLQEINKDNATTEEFINYINTNEEAQAEIDNAGVPETTTENTSEANAVVPTAKTEAEIAKLESERDATVAAEAKPDVSFTWIPVKALAKNVSSSALQVRKETQDALKEKANTLKSLIDCLHGK